MNILCLPGSSVSFNQLRPELEMYAGFMDRGHDVTVVIEPDSVYMPRLTELGMNVLHCYPTRKICPSSIRALRTEMRTRHYDIVYASASKTIPNAAFAAIGFPARLVTYRGTTGGAYWYDPTNYLTVFNPRTDGIVCVSEAVRQYLAPRLVKTGIRLAAIHKGHDLAWYQKPPVDLAEFGITKNDFPVVCVTNARPHKGLRYLLEAASALSDIANLHLLLVGKDIQAEPCLDLIAKSGMAERIHLTGFRHDAPEIIAACKVLVLPSVRDGFPRVVLEAMGYGVPAIVTDSGGCAEVVDDGINGCVIPIRDAGAIARSIRKLHENPASIRLLSAACCQKIEGDMTVRVTVDKYLAFFGELLERR